MAGCQNWKAESLGATVCWVCMRNRALCLANFGTASAIDGNWEPAVAINAIFLCLPRAERNQRFLFVQNESIKFCCSGGFSNVPDVMEASVLFISTVFHVRSVACCCLYLGFRVSCAARVTRVTRVTCSKRSLLGVPLELE